VKGLAAQNREPFLFSVAGSPNVAPREALASRSQPRYPVVEVTRG